VAELNEVGVDADAEKRRLAGLQSQIDSLTTDVNTAPMPMPRVLWRVLSVDVAASRALVITRDIVAKKAYHVSIGRPTWADCTLRRWLNTEFWSSLPASLQARVVEVTNHNNAGEETRDKVFLLDVTQARALFENDADRVARFGGDGCWWWLRSRGNFDYSAARVVGPGSVDRVGDVTCLSCGGVRPALFINLASGDPSHRAGGASQPDQ